MINRVFFILESDWIPGDEVLPEENVYYSALVSPGIEGSLQTAYGHFEKTSLPGMALTLEIRESLSADSLRSVSSFLFIPSYLKIGNKPVINLTGKTPEMLSAAASALSGYLALQGYPELIIHILSSGATSVPNACRLFLSVEELTVYYNSLLHNDFFYNNDIFFSGSPKMWTAALAALREAESDLAKQCPRLYSLLVANGRQDRELQSLRIKHLAMEAELANQRQYLEILRSDHPTREIQDYYTKEYEILPLWYKRFGHIIKVLTGKRTFRSLYRDDVKKYKD